jgi:predicted Zn-dependent protease
MTGGHEARKPRGSEPVSSVVGARVGRALAAYDLPPGEAVDNVGGRQWTSWEQNVMSFGGYGYDQREGPVSGDLLRWVGALLIALFGLGMYMFRTQTNPVTGEVQHIAMGVNEEKALGLQAAPRMASKMGGAIDPRDDERAALVSEVGRRIVSRSEARRSPYVDNFHFYLLNDPRTINAFALPGGQVFITRGLFDRLRNEAQLAGVLGHEIGHVIARHSAQQMAKGQLGQILTTAMGVGASGGRDRGRTAMMASAMANQMLSLRYSREDESQADEIGLKYMAQAGYDPRSMLDVMRILKEASSGNRQPEFLATHPLPETRLEAIQQELEKSYPDGVPGNLTRGRTL